MGVEGAVLAVGALFVLAYVVPQISRSRGALADTPIGERYSRDLRLITERKLTQTSGDNGRIFTRERTMSTPAKARRQRGAGAAKLRAAARDRSRARARIAKRAAAQQRALFGAAILVAITVVLWLFAGATAMPAALAIAATAVGGVYLLGLGAVISNWSRLNDEDGERISRANKLLRAGRVDQRKIAARKNDAGVRVGEDRGKDERASSARTERVGTDHVSAEDPRVTANKTLAADDEKLAAVGKTRGVEGRRSPRNERVSAPTRADEMARENAVVGAEARRIDAVRYDAVPQTVASTPPSYTLKPDESRKQEIRRRNVAPYVAPAEPEADVPYRPTRPGERLGDEPLEKANPAPEMTGMEELRSDVLGGGSTLDALLDRRRA